MNGSKCMNKDEYDILYKLFLFLWLYMNSENFKDN